MADEVINRLISPETQDAAAILRELGLDRLPTREEIDESLEADFLTPQLRLPPHKLSTYQYHWGSSISVPSLLTLEPTQPSTTLAFVRKGLNGDVVGYKEVPASTSQTALTSTSLERAPGSSADFVRGKSGNIPFWPGGLDAPKAKDLKLVLGEEDLDKGKLKTVPPGFKRGLRLPGEHVAEDEELVIESQDGENETGVQEESLASTFSRPEAKPRQGTKFDSELDELLPINNSSIAPISSQRVSRKLNPAKRDWAHVVDVNKTIRNFHELVPDMAHKYPFELDTFQKEAVYHLEQGDSVFVAAHTSAGKTVVAEYAIALAAKHMTRAIYTSPIKALSNQKFRDFKTTFSSANVGILTGDVQINPEAPCLIMTTEILRSMLYKGADLIRDVEFVIFDEVHYVNDIERGVVWEEVIIMLPEHVSIILLSATVPNTQEFAEWVGRTKKKDIYVISTKKRPVPLEHFLYAGKEMYKIVNAKGEFLGEGYKEAGEALRRKQDKEREAAGLPPVQRLGARGAALAKAGQRGAPGRGGTQGGGRGASNPMRGGGGGRPPLHRFDKNLYVHLVGHLRKKNLLPVVVFTFSKKRCEENASTLSNVDLCVASEKSQTHVEVEKAMSRLKGSDKNLPQISRMRDLLSRGIGVHHGGLLPIVKELVEILFSRGLVKVLFATETFAMGVNMPARCVVFSSIRKHDGTSFRELLAGEYTQMSGRAGRRGLDDTGVVIIAVENELPETPTLHKMMLGQPSKLQSQFRLTYNMILNLLRVEALKVEEMIKRSFSENAAQRLLPDQQERVVETEKTLSKYRKLECAICEGDINRYYDTSLDVVALTQDIHSLASRHPQGSKAFVAGRVVVLRDGHFRGNIGVVLKPAPFQVQLSGIIDSTKVYWMLAAVSQKTKDGQDDVDPQAVPPLPTIDPTKLVVEDAVYELRAVPITSVLTVSNRTIKVDVDAIAERHRISFMNEAIRHLQAVVREWIDEGSVPEFDFGKIKAFEFQAALQKRGVHVQSLAQNACLLCESFQEHYSILHGEKVLRRAIANLKLAISDQNLELLPDYEQRVDVLKELNFIDDNSTVSLKGRVACEINSADELILTELILENILATFTSEEVVALLSAFVFQEKTEVEPVIPPRLEEGRDQILAIADRVEVLQNRHKVAESTSKKLKFGLMEVVYEWAKGMPFEQITALTDVPEGTIVRVITRLDETCREVRDAARVIGDAELFKKMEEAQGLIKRDIVFVASLYF
ncbi:ATP-dependent RNA helicase [Sistotremastrum suecicum HHB10207 ss-3]|uniref:ATP-dependent RNA helicase n=1 Tax=Sistotremastrum suecicum HHB10207 ss-3 TaxID=1314776 RepID=A0A166GEZ0_9AGAM|nr:ATP-dependent RNA helicase [Sistotremastrum suecicum HHB10207 ss-3]